jgi:putative pyruvate formate lyase activating enzyme
MSQYYPAHKATGHGQLGRGVTAREYGAVLEWATQLGFENYYAQGMESVRLYRPDFDTDSVFDRTDVQQEIERRRARPGPE